MLRALLLLGLLLCFPASEGVKFDVLYNLGNIIFYGSWSGFYTIYWETTRTCNRNLTDHGHVLRVDDNIIMFSNFSMDINDITGEDRSATYNDEWNEEPISCYGNFSVKCEDEIGQTFTCDVKEVTDGKVTCSHTTDDFTCAAGFRDVDCSSSSPLNGDKTATCDVTQVPTITNYPNNGNIYKYLFKAFMNNISSVTFQCHALTPSLLSALIMMILISPKHK